VLPIEILPGQAAARTNALGAALGIKPQTYALRGP
jgi:hypothetical protein